MADGVGNLMGLPIKTDASGAVVIAITTILTPTGTASTGAAGPLPSLPVKTTASNELVVRFV